MYQYRCRVVRVIDGDSVVVDIDLGFYAWLKNQHVRLAGIDAPEVRTRDLDEKVRGLAAKAFLAEMLPPGCEVVLQSREFNRGKYGRIIGVILLDSRSVNCVMVETGHATVSE